jgi:hypothetical protein
VIQLEIRPFHWLENERPTSFDRLQFVMIRPGGGMQEVTGSHQPTFGK